MSIQVRYTSINLKCLQCSISSITMKKLMDFLVDRSHSYIFDLTHTYTGIIVRWGLESRRAPHDQGPSCNNSWSFISLKSLNGALFFMDRYNMFCCYNFREIQWRRWRNGRRRRRSWSSVRWRRRRRSSDGWRSTYGPRRIVCWRDAYAQENRNETRSVECIMEKRGLEF